MTEVANILGSVHDTGESFGVPFLFLLALGILSKSTPLFLTESEEQKCNLRVAVLKSKRLSVIYTNCSRLWWSRRLSVLHLVDLIEANLVLCTF